MASRTPTPEFGTVRTDDDQEVSYASYGAAPETVVLVHGITLDRRIWAPQVRDLLDRLRTRGEDLVAHLDLSRMDQRLAVEAVEMMERYRINALLVADPDGCLLGALNMHDLFMAKVI